MLLQRPISSTHIQKLDRRCNIIPWRFLLHVAQKVLSAGYACSTSCSCLKPIFLFAVLDLKVIWLLHSSLVYRIWRHAHKPCYCYSWSTLLPWSTFYISSYAPSRNNYDSKLPCLAWVMQEIGQLHYFCFSCFCSVPNIATSRPCVESPIDITCNLE